MGIYFHHTNFISKSTASLELYHKNSLVKIAAQNAQEIQLSIKRLVLTIILGQIFSQIQLFLSSATKLQFFLLFLCLDSDAKVSYLISGSELSS